MININPNIIGQNNNGNSDWHEPGETQSLSLEFNTNRMISVMRLLLAFSALLVIYIDPSEPNRLVALVYTSLVLYCLYSSCLYLLSVHRPHLLPVHLTHWIDVAWYLALISLSYGTSSIFFFFFFFPILIASFRWGFISGWRVTVVSALLFTVIGYATASSGEEFELNRFLLRPVYLLVLGYMISYWGGREITLKRRLELLKEVSRLSNPRFGADRTLNVLIQRIHSFYDADSCLLVSESAESGNVQLREVNRNVAVEIVNVEETEAANPLLSLPGNYAILYQNKGYPWHFSKDCRVVDLSSNKNQEDEQSICPVLADLLNAESYITIPLGSKRESINHRLYVTSQDRKFNWSDIEFLRQLGDQVLPVLENIRLLDKLASQAAEQQRQKISRDIHDSTVQPYIGIKLGLEALQLKCEVGESVVDDVEKLIKLANTSITDLRRYVRTLREENNEMESNVLITAVKQQALKYKEFYDINCNSQDLI